MTASRAASADAIFAGGGEMGRLINAYDWAASPLGHPDAWPQSLRTAVSIMLGSRYAMWMAWGDELTFFCNDAYRPTLGIKAGWALGARSDLVWDEVWDEAGPRIRTVLATGVATWDEDLLLFLERSGYREETYHTFSYSPLRDDLGAVAGMLCVVTEETERVIGTRRLGTLRQLASELSTAQTEADVSRAVENALGTNRRDLPFSLLYLFDGANGCARLVAATGIGNGHAAAPATIDLAGGEDPWPALTIRDVGTPMTLEELPDAIGPLPTGDWHEPPRKALLYPIARQGSEAPAGMLVVALNPFRKLDGNYSDFIGLLAGQVAASLANVHAYEYERHRADALAEIDQAKTAFFSNVSHEFRTPLTLMLGPLEEMLSTGTADLSLIETAHRNGLRLLKLVNTLLDFSRIEAGRAQASFEPVDLAALTADVASNFRSAMERAGLEFHVDTPSLPQAVQVDREMWEKIVLNLLSNAFKFTFDGGVTVSLTASPDGSEAVLRVTDSGTGIPADELPRLFERFHRVAGASGRSFEGSGIGLALVQELVRLHGGTIQVDSQQGVGSTFIVSLPIGSTHLPADRVRVERPSFSSAVRVQAYVEEALGWLPDVEAEEIAFLSADRMGTAALVPAVVDGRVLLADDNADMRDYVRRLLVGHGYDVEAVGDGEAALASARRRSPDLVLSDVMMPRLDGIGLLEAMRADEALRDVPTILLSARAGEEARVAGVKAGAADYLTKPFSARELLARVGANLATAKLRREAMEALRAVNETLAASVAERTRERDSIWRLSHELMVVVQPDTTVLALNPAWHVVLGWQESELLGRRSADLVHLDDLPESERHSLILSEGRPIIHFENRLRHKDGSYRLISWTAVPSEGVFYCVGRDMTQARELEGRLQQAQKMETIGQLTGGVAHDFNNLLTVISGNLENIQRDAARLAADPPGTRIRHAVDNAMRGAHRAAVLTQRLLAFSRRQPLEPKPVNVNRLVAGMSDLLLRTLGEQVEIETVLGGGLWPVLVDANQLENALLNLAINGRDAMADGGKLTIETANAHLNDLYAAENTEVVAGQYVQIAVSDTGVGMASEVLTQAIQPFFTTKGAGHGTGLGLSQVYGFVKQSGGHIKLYSELGQGTAVKIYLPRLMTARELMVSEIPEESEQPLGEHSETVLVVEDDPDVRSYTVAAIRDLGYRVLEAASGVAALDVLRAEPGVTLLFTDVGLPGGMNGRQVADAARAVRADLPVLFTTGYARNAIVHGGRLDAGVQLITKPFTRAALAAKLREVMDAALAPGRVLLVEDEALVRMVAAQTLSDAGYLIDEAGTAAEALAKARSWGGRLAAVVMDFNLPDRPGDALADDLRAVRADLPLVVVSGYSDQELMDRFAGMGAVTFVAKPYDTARLVDALTSMRVFARPARSPA